MVGLVGPGFSAVPMTTPVEQWREIGPPVAGPAQVTHRSEDFVNSITCGFLALHNRLCRLSLFDSERY